MKLKQEIEKLSNGNAPTPTKSSITSDKPTKRQAAPMGSSEDNDEERAAKKSKKSGKAKAETSDTEKTEYDATVKHEETVQ